MRYFALFLCVVCQFAITNRAAADEENIEWLGQVGGSCQAVAPFGGYLAAGRGSWLLVLDYSTPSQPHAVGKLRLNDTVRLISINGDFAYIALEGVYPVGNGSLAIVDVSDPTNPQLESIFQCGATAYYMDVSGDRVYLVSQFQIHIIDVTDPRAPSEVISFFPPAGFSGPIAGDGDHVFLCNRTNSKLGIVSILSPSNLAGQCALPQNVQGLIRRGNLCYALGYYALSVIDADDLSNPEVAHSHEFTIPQQAIAHSDNRLYTTDGLNVSIYGLDDPFEPALIGQGALQHTGSTILAADGDWLFAATLNGIRFVDVANVADVEERGFFSMPYQPTAVSALDTFAVVGTLSAGAIKVDVSVPNKPVIVGPFAGTGLIQDVERHGERMYVADSDRIFSIRISDPSHPLLLGSFRGRANRLRARGDRLYYSGQINYWDDYGLVTLDVSGNSPTLLGKADLWGNTGHRDFDASGSLILTETYTNDVGLFSEFAFFDFSSPSMPVPLQEILPDYAAESAGLSSKYAFLGESNDIRIVDISDIQHPESVGSWPIYEGSVTVIGNVLITTSYSDGLVLVDISDPSTPRQMAIYPHPVRRVTMRDEYLYVAAFNRGFEVLRYTGDLPEPPPPTRFRASDGSPDDVVHLKWDMMAGADRYDVWRTGSKDLSATHIASAYDPSYDDDSVAPNTPYEYYVTATFGTRTSAASKTDIGYIGDVTSPYIAVTPNERNLGPESGQTSFEVANTGVDHMNWTATVESADWLRITGSASGTDAGTIIVDYDGNETDADRTAFITIFSSEAANSPVQVAVHQLGRPRIAVSGAEQLFSHIEGKHLLTIENSGGGVMAWNAEVLAGDWMSLSGETSGSDTGSVTLKLQKNNSLEPRVGALRFTAADATNNPLDVQITQSAMGRIVVVTPNGGERWARGARRKIRWSTEGDAGDTVRIELLRKGAFVKLIDDRTRNDGKLVWTVGQDIPAKGGYTIRIISLLDGDVQDTSDATFAIHE